MPDRRGSRASPGVVSVGAGCALAATAFLCLSVWGTEALAADVEVQAQTAAQFYEVMSPWGDTTLERRRFMQTLGLAVYNIQGKYRPGEADYSVALLLRLDADFGIDSHLEGAQSGGETSYQTDTGLGTRYVPGLSEAPLDLMYGYVDGRNLAGGFLGFRLGRQYISDVLGWWSFDGGLVRVTTPFYVQAEVYGGFEQRGGLPLSTSRFERQGVWRGSHADFGSGSGQPSVVDYPSYQYTQPAPAFGVALESAGPSFVHGRFDYRRVYDTGTSVAQQLPDPRGGDRRTKGMRISQDRLGYAADATLRTIGGLKGGFTYDLYNDLVGSFYGGLEAYLGRRVVVGADADYYVPTFDADSIWNWFTHSPITTLTGRTAVRFTERFDVSASGGGRLWSTEGDPESFARGECEAALGRSDCTGLTFDPSAGGAAEYVRSEEAREGATLADGLANLAGRYRWTSGDVSLRGMLEAGERGRRTGADLAAEQRLGGGRYALGARVSVYDWNDPLRYDTDGQLGRGATSFGYVLAGGLRPVDIADLRVEWEHDMNKLVGHRFRVVGLVTLRVTR